MAIDHVLLIIMSLAVVAVVLISLGHAIGQFDSVLKTVLRPPKDEPYPQRVRLRVTGAVVVAAAIAALSVVIALLTR